MNTQTNDLTQEEKEMLDNVETAKEIVLREDKKLLEELGHKCKSAKVQRK